MPIVHVDEDVFKFVYVIAMRDATLQKAYPYEKKWLYDLSALPTTEKYLRRYIDWLLGKHFIDQADHDGCFLETASHICHEISGVNAFNFGNAQKLINMMVKFLYIVSFKELEKKSCFEYCHCPMDSILLAHTWKEKNNLDKKNIIREKLENMGSDTFLDGWSKEVFKVNPKTGMKSIPDRYCLFQDAIREIIKTTPYVRAAGGRTIYPIEFDYHIW